MLTIALKLMVNKLLRCLKKVSMLDSKLMKRKKSQLMIYADFESILMPEDNEKQIPYESYTNKCQKHVACSYYYKLVC